MNQRITTRSRTALLLFVFFSLVFVVVTACSREVVNSASAQTAPKEAPCFDNSFQSELVDFALIGSTNAWATDRSGTAFYHTKTGGSLQRTATNFGRKPLISFLDAKTGFAVGYSSEVRLWRTRDGGQTWQKVKQFHANEKDFPGTVLSQLHFADAQHGWIVSVFGVWRTQDGGVHWDNVFKRAVQPELTEIYQGAFSGTERAVIAASDGIYLTVDGGRSWKLTRKNKGFCVIYFLDEHTGWVWSESLLRTDDSGNSWRELYKLDGYAEIRSTQFINKEEGWATGIELEESFGSVVRNPDSPAFHGVLLHTSDGGKNWEHASVPANRIFDRVAFSDSKHGWLLGVNRVYRTGDGGATWTTALDLPH